MSPLDCQNRGYRVLECVLWVVGLRGRIESPQLGRGKSRLPCPMGPRRLSLPGSEMGEPQGDRGVTWEGLALEGSAHRQGG